MEPASESAVQAELLSRPWMSLADANWGDPDDPGSGVRLSLRAVQLSTFFRWTSALFLAAGFFGISPQLTYNPVSANGGAPYFTLSCPLPQADSRQAFLEALNASLDAYPI
jgi:hypothetical protein